MNTMLIIALAIIAVLASCLFRSIYLRRKAATETAMRCFAMSDNPAVKASRKVH